MQITDMDADLKRFTDFEQLSDRVSYWRRRLAASSRKEAMTEEFDTIVSKHSLRVLGVLRAG